MKCCFCFVVIVVVLVVVHVVVVDPINLPLRFGLNRVRNSWDFNDIEFVVMVGGWWFKVIFVSNPTFELSCGWVGVVTILLHSSFIWNIYLPIIYFLNRFDFHLSSFIKNWHKFSCYAQLIPGLLCFVHFFQCISNSLVLILDRS